jgi:hypothetical protein
MTPEDFSTKRQANPLYETIPSESEFYYHYTSWGGLGHILFFGRPCIQSIFKNQ